MFKKLCIYNNTIKSYNRSQTLLKMLTGYIEIQLTRCQKYK